MKGKGFYISPVYRRYRLEPGNGSSYDFSITWLAVPKDDLVKVVAGVQRNPYVTITFHYNPEPGTYEFMIESVTNYKPHLRYMKQKLPHVNENDVEMVMRACSVLVNRPMDIGGACAAMMEE